MLIITSPKVKKPPNITKNIQYHQIFTKNSWFYFLKWL